MRSGCAVGAVVGLVVVAAALATPTVRYLLRAGWSEARILLHRRPIATVIADSSTPPRIRAQLELVLQARSYAADSLGLRVKGSFTTYAKLEHDTLVLVVSGAARDALRPLTWWFPIVGRVPYKGYFDVRGAERAADDLRQRGFDVIVRPSPAFSTLGWFDDPLVSTTLKADSIELVNTVIHEVTHNTYYGSGQAAFNESFASFVGARGSERFFRARGDSSSARDAAERWADEKTLGAFWTAVYNRLDSAFRAHRGSDTASRQLRLAARDTIYADARDSLTRDIGRRLHTVPHGAMASVRLDNAALLARLVYATDLDQFDALYAANDGDLRRTVAQIIEIARTHPDDPFAGLRAAVTQAAARPTTGPS